MAAPCAPWPLRCESLTQALTDVSRSLFSREPSDHSRAPLPFNLRSAPKYEDNAAAALKKMSQVEPELAPVPLRLGRSAPPGRGWGVAPAPCAAKTEYVLGTSREDTPRVNAGVRLSSGSQAPRRDPLAWREIAGSRRAARHVRASPSRALPGRGRASGRRSGRSDWAAYARLGCELERLGDRHPADPRVVTSARTRLSCSSARRKIVRGWPCEVDAAPLGAERRGQTFEA
jgi:hypothetical protein